MICIFPVIGTAISSGTITAEYIAVILNKDVEVIERKLSGKEQFNINEAMTINIKLFPSVPFEVLFSKSNSQ